RYAADAEATTEKVLAAITADYKNYGQGYVLTNLDYYRRIVPTTDENSDWANYLFMNVAGTSNRTYVTYTPSPTFKVVSSQYAGLKGFANSFQVISNVRELDSGQNAI